VRSPPPSPPSPHHGTPGTRPCGGVPAPRAAPVRRPLLTPGAAEGEGAAGAGHPAARLQQPGEGSLHPAAQLRAPQALQADGAGPGVDGPHHQGQVRQHHLGGRVDRAGPTASPPPWRWPEWPPGSGRPPGSSPPGRGAPAPWLQQPGPDQPGRRDNGAGISGKPPPPLPR
jgi:hypothetical protein